MQRREHNEVLVVDDEPKIRTVFRRTLSNAGYVPVEARDGKTALKLLRKHDHGIRIVILDILMPRLDGRELFQTIRRERPDLKVIVASVFSEEEQKTRVFQADGYYDKSGRLIHLVEQVRHLMGRG